MKSQKFFLFKKSNIKLLLYVFSASLTSLLADIKRYTEPSRVPISSLSDLSSVNLVYIFINFALQGIIAWRAFMDTSCKEENNSTEDCCEETTKTQPVQTKNERISSSERINRKKI